MEVISKKQKAQAWLAQQQKQLQCPLCGKPFLVTETSLRCANGHTYDIAKKGYVNFCLQSKSSFYEKDLFTARGQVLQQGFYQPLLDKMVSLLTANLAANTCAHAAFCRTATATAGLSAAAPTKTALQTNSLSAAMPTKTAPQTNCLSATAPLPIVLDAGCGEGYYTAHLAQKLSSSYAFLGIDLAKEGILQAALYPSCAQFALADLARLPLAAGSVAAILNILSPANFAEFARVLQPGGQLIKVIPGAAYLQEIRTLLGEKDYDNQETLAHSRLHIKNLRETHLFYTNPLTPAQSASFCQMTPLSGKKVLPQTAALTQITIDLYLLAGSL